MTAAALSRRPALPPLAGLAPRAALVTGALVLAASPAAWLANSWADPSYASQGGLFFAVTAALFAWYGVTGRTVGSGFRFAAPE